VVKLTHSVAFTDNYFFSERQNVFVDSETFLMTDFVNLKIRAAQFFRDAHRERVRVFI
jgi:hypothetical protein